MKTTAVILFFLLAVSSNQVHGESLRRLLESDLVSHAMAELMKFLVNLFPPTIQTTPKYKITDEYDFVIVGSGPAGSAVAARLSEITGWNILLLEAGKSENFIASMPFFAPLLQWTPYNWGHKMEYQENACKAMEDKVCSWPRGKALGGSSVINYMMYTRGNKEEYDIWERNGNTGWDYKTMLEYYKKSEKEQLDDDLIEKPYHGENGYLHTEHTFHSELTNAMIEAGNGNKTVWDYNGSNQIVFSRIQGTVNKGARDSAAKSYLVPAMKRKNLHVLTEAHVTKIILDDNNVARGVEYLYRGKKYTVKAKKEVILSAGVFNSPQLLMLSGIGPKGQLEKFSQNLRDHMAYIGLTLLFNKKYENFFSSLNPIYIAQWLLTGKGPIASLGGVSGVGFEKTSVADYVENIPNIEYMLISTGGFMSDYGWFVRKVFGITDEFYKTSMSEPNPGSGMIFPLLLKPKSKGYLELKSADPLDHVKLYANYFSDPQDKKTLIAGIRRVIEMANTEPLKSMGARLSSKRIPECLKYGDLTDEYFSCALEYLTVTMFHQTGTCKMGPSSDKEAVVGPDLKVYNVGNLRVIDCSIIPDSLTAHMNAPAFAIGEKGADLIKQYYGV